MTVRQTTRPAFLLAWVLVSLGSTASFPLFAQPAPDPALVAGLRKAQGLIRQKNFPAAEQTLRPLTEQFHDKPMPWFLLGSALASQKKYETAQEAFEQSAQFPPFQANSLYNIACIHAAQGEKDQALEKLENAVRLGFSQWDRLQSDPDLASLSNEARFQNLLPKWLPDDQLFAEPTRIIHQWTGENAGDQFGWTARRVGDLDQDGVIDFIATAPTFQQGAGKIYVYSSRTGNLLHSITGQPGQRLGNSAVGVGDMNQDGTPDFIAGAPSAGGTGAAFVYSGKDGALIHAIQGKTKGGRFGYEVSEVGDMDSDGVPDFLVGELAGNGQQPASGRVIVYSGRNAEIIFELTGKQSGDEFGNAAAAVSLGNQEFLLAIGAPKAGPSNRGTVEVYRVTKAIPEWKFTIQGDQNSVHLGQMFISFPGDLDQDGVPDVYASDFSDNTGAPGAGKVVIHSGSDGRELLQVVGQFPGEGLGTSPSDAGDVDGDSIGDLVIGAWQNRQGAPSGGRVYLYSTADVGRPLRTWTSRQFGDTLGFDACGIGDVDQDGHIDFLLTSAWSRAKGKQTGRIFIVAGDRFESPPNRKSD